MSRLLILSLLTAAVAWPQGVTHVVLIGIENYRNQLKLQIAGAGHAWQQSGGQYQGTDCTHWNGSTSGSKPIRMNIIPFEIVKALR